MIPTLLAHSFAVNRTAVVLDDNAVVVTGFYLFTVMREGKPISASARFTMLVTKRNGVGHLAYHHSSPQAQPK